MAVSHRAPATGPARRGGGARVAAAIGALALAGAGIAVPARAQELEPQFREIRTLVKEKRYPLALESLRLVARQIQDLRLESVAPAFPAAPSGWRPLAALSLLDQDEVWSSRIVAQRGYIADQGPARMDITIDVNTPFGAAAAMSLNPLVAAADPRARILEIGGETGLLRFNPDTGEGELRVLIRREVLVTARGRGITSPETLIDLARGVDFAFLRTRTGL